MWVCVRKLDVSVEGCLSRIGLVVCLCVLFLLPISACALACSPCMCCPFVCVQAAAVAGVAPEASSHKTLFAKRVIVPAMPLAHCKTRARCVPCLDICIHVNAFVLVEICVCV